MKWKIIDSRLKNDWSKFVPVLQLLEEQKKFDDELRRQLKLQEQVHADHLQETITLKEEEAERNLQRALNEQSEQDSIKHKEQLAVVIGRLRGVEAAFKGEYFFFFLHVFSSMEK